MNQLWWNKMKPWVIQMSLLILIGLLAWFGIWPLLDLIQEQKDEIQKISVLQEHRSSELQRLPELEKYDGLIQEHGPELELMPTKDELVTFISDLERLADQSRVHITISSQDNTLLESKVTAQPSKGNAKGDTADVSDDAESSTSADKRKPKGPGGILDALPLKRYIRLNILVQAPYAAMTEYLHKVETMGYAVEVVNLVVKEATEEDRAMLEGDALAVSSGARAAAVPLSSNMLSTTVGLVIFTRE